MAVLNGGGVIVSSGAGVAGLLEAWRYLRSVVEISLPAYLYLIRRARL